MVTICIYQVKTIWCFVNSVELPKLASSMISVMYLSVTSRRDIILNCFWYDFFMGHLHQNQLLCKVFIIVFFFMNNDILLCDVRSSCGKIQLGLICIKHMHFFYLFLWAYIKNIIFYEFVLLVKMTQDRNAFLMWSVIWFFILFLQSWNCVW